MSSSSASAAVSGARRKAAAAAATDTDDYARFGEDAKRSVYLLKIPVDVMAVWRPLFENGGVEITRNSGVRDLEPKMDLGTIDGDLTSGAIVNISDSQGKHMQYRLSLRPITGMRQRVISAEVGDRGQNVKFEGVIEQTGQLMPVAADQAYKDVLKERVEAGEVRAQVKTIGQKEELEAMRKQGRIVIKGGSSGQGDEEDGPEGGSSNKRRKIQKDDSESAAKAAPPPKKKVAKKKEKDLSPEAVREALFKCFDKIDPETGQKKKYWKKKELRKTTGLQLHIMNPILQQIAEYHQGGAHDKTYSLKYNE